MKRFLTCTLYTALLGFASFCSLTSSAQTLVQTPPPPPNLNQPGLGIDSVVRYLQATITSADSGEGGRASQIATFSRIWKDRVTQNDNSGNNMFEQYLHSAYNATQARTASNNCGGSNAFKGQWKNDGPDSFPTQNIGRLKDVWVHPTDISKLLVSGEGGVWKSIDTAKNWKCITNNTSFVGGIVSPNVLAVNPNNSNNIYVGSFTYPNHVLFPYGLGFINGSYANSANYGHGILVTSDGGTNWHQEFLPFNNAPLTFKDSLAGAKPYFSPDGQRVYAFRANHLFYKQIGGSWEDITPFSQIDSSRYFYELKFVPNSSGTLDPNHFFVTTHVNGRLVEFTYNPVTQQHNQPVAIPLPTGNNLPNPILGYYISIPTNNMLYAAIGNKLYRYNIGSHNWNHITDLYYTYTNSNGGIDTSKVNIWEGGFEASKSNPACLYLADKFNVSHFSNDTGHSLIHTSTYYGNPTHGDVRRVFIQHDSNFGTGIRSYNAGYNVLPICNSVTGPCANPIRNVFTGLQHGIEAESDGFPSDNTLAVDRAEFRNCGAGILARGVNNFSVIRSNFKIGNSPFNYQNTCYQNIGIRVLTSCSGFSIDQNTFTAVGGSGYTRYGVSADSTGGANKSIWGNSFSGQNAAVLATGPNGEYIGFRAYTNQSGLLIKCNTFSGNTADIAIGTEGTIHPDQGSALLSAGNVFGANGWLVNYNPHPAFNTLYYWHTGGNTLPQIVGATPLVSQHANGCAPRHTDEPVLATTFRNTFLNAKGGWTATQNQYTAQVDGGNTPALLQNIQNSPAGAGASLASQLLSIAPYVSEPALRAVGDGVKLTTAQFTNVLQANPDVLRHPGFMHYLATGLPEPLPQTNLQVLEQAAGTVTARGNLEAQMQDQYKAVIQSGNDWLTAAKTDTTGAARDSIESILSQIPSLEARYAGAGRYLAAGNRGCLRCPYGCNTRRI